MTAFWPGPGSLVAWVVAAVPAAVGGHLARSAARAGRARRRLGTVGPTPARRRLPLVVGRARASAAACSRWGRRLAWLRPSTDLDHALVLEAVARSLRGGGSLSQAIDDAVQSLPASAAAVELGEAARRVAAGARWRDALDAWSARPDDARVLAGAALTLGAELGGASARSLDAAAGGLRDRARLAREVRALTSQARSSALVMVTAPVAFLVVAASADRQIAVVLMASPAGWLCLAVGVALDLVGAAWMARMTRQGS